MGSNLQNDQLVEISHFYFDYLSSAVKTFEDAILRLKNCDISQFEIADAVDMAHRIKGNAAMYGFPRLGLKAADTEAYLRDFEQHLDVLETRQLLTRLIEAIQNIQKGHDGLEDSGEQDTPKTKPVEVDETHQIADLPLRQMRIVIAYKDVWISNLMSNLFGPEYDITICQTEDELFTSLDDNKYDLLILENEFSQTDETPFLETLLASEFPKDLPLLVTFEPNSAQSIAKSLSLGIENFVEDKYEVLDVVISAKSILKKISKKVLVVDDDPIVRSLLSHVLMSKGLEVDTAADGLEALSYLSNNRPDIVLLDRFMPRLEGGTVLYEIQNKINLKSTPVLILTAMVNQGEAKSWFERGAADFIPKPFDPEEVLMRVMQHLERAKRVG